MTKTNLKKLSMVGKYIIGFKFSSTSSIEYTKTHKKYLNKVGKIIAYNEEENIFHVFYLKTYVKYPGQVNQAGTFKVMVWHKNGLNTMFKSIRSLFPNNDAKLQQDGTCTFIITRNDLINESIKKTITNLSTLVSLVTK